MVQISVVRSLRAMSDESASGNIDRLFAEARQLIGADDAEREPRMARSQQRERRENERRTDERDRHDQLPLGLLARRFDRRATARHRRHRRAAVLEEHRALARQRRGTGTAQEEGDAEFLLERAHRLADRRRTHRERGRGTPEAAGLGHGDERHDATKQIESHQRDVDMVRPIHGAQSKRILRERRIVATAPIHASTWG